MYQPDYPPQPHSVVLRVEDAPALEAPAKKSSTKRSLPKWEVEAHERVKAGVKKYTRPLNDLCSRDANEGDTRLLVTDFLTDVLGFDKYEDLTTEYAVKGEFADYGIRIDRDLIAFLEVKRVATKLATKHLRQVEMYAVNEGVEWVILTNGAVWRAYHLTAGLPVVIDLALDVDLLGDETPTKKAQQLFYLSRESLRKRRINELWETKRATSPSSLAQVLTSSSVTEAIRKELRRKTGQRVEPSEISKLVKETVIRPEAFD
jgi:hypothetical protein